MNNSEIFKRAIDKAWKNGYTKGKRIKHWHYFNYFADYAPFIFDHDFAKAFWGEEPEEMFTGFESYYSGDGFTEDRNVYEEKIPWQYHLQQIVLAPEPLEYLEKFL